MQSYPLHTHNVVLFLVSRWKQTFGVRRVVSVADRTWENIDLTFSSLLVQHSILITSTFGNCYDDSLHLGIITHPPWARLAGLWVPRGSPHLFQHPSTSSSSRKKSSGCSNPCSSSSCYHFRSPCAKLHLQNYFGGLFFGMWLLQWSN